MAGGWEGSATAYERSFAPLCAGTVPAIIDCLGPGRGRLLLDIGTGPGTVAAAARLNGDRVIGMDSDSSMTALAARRHPDVPFARGALPRLPCVDEAFDAVTANFVVNHTPDPRAAVNELARVTRRGGVLVATIWTSQVVPLNQLWNEVMQAAEVVPPAGTRLAAHLDFERTTSGFAGIIADAGFGAVNCRETRWIFTPSPDDLWAAVEAGIAVIGQTYMSLGSAGRRRMRTAYDQVTRARSAGDGVSLPSVALVASARRTPSPREQGTNQPGGAGGESEMS